MMKTFRFRTTAEELGDVEKIKIHLKEISGITECYFENNAPGSALVIKAEGISAEMLSSEIFKAGYRNELIKSGWKKAAKRLFKKDCCG